MRNVTLNGSVTVNGLARTGGVIGWLGGGNSNNIHGLLDAVTVNGNLTVNGNNNTGGIVGETNGTVRNITLPDPPSGGSPGAAGGTVVQDHANRSSWSNPENIFQVNPAGWITHSRQGSWVRWDNVDLRGGITGWSLAYATPNNNVRIEVRVSAPGAGFDAATPIGAFDIGATGGWYTEVTTAVNPGTSSLNRGDIYVHWYTGEFNFRRLNLNLAAAPPAPATAGGSLTVNGASNVGGWIGYYAGTAMLDGNGMPIGGTGISETNRREGIIRFGGGINLQYPHHYNWIAMRVRGRNVENLRLATNNINNVLVLDGSNTDNFGSLNTYNWVTLVVNSTTGNWRNNDYSGLQGLNIMIDAGHLEVDWIRYTNDRYNAYALGNSMYYDNFNRSYADRNIAIGSAADYIYNAFWWQQWDGELYDGVLYRDVYLSNGALVMTDNLPPTMNLNRFEDGKAPAITAAFDRMVWNVKAFTLAPNQVGAILSDNPEAYLNIHQRRFTADAYMGYDSANLYMTLIVNDPTFAPNPRSAEDMWQMHGFQMNLGRDNARHSELGFALGTDNRMLIHNWMGGGIDGIGLHASQAGSVVAYNIRIPARYFGYDSLTPEIARNLQINLAYNFPRTSGVADAANLPHAIQFGNFHDKNDSFAHYSSTIRLGAPVNIHITGSGSHVGGIVGNATSGTSDHPIIRGFALGNSVRVTATGGNHHIGGIVGQKNHGAIRHCTVDGVILDIWGGSDFVGGIAGTVLRGRVENCYAVNLEGNLRVSGRSNIGGIVGHVSDANAGVWDCVVINSDIRGTGSNHGRIAGQLSPGGGHRNFVRSVIVWQANGNSQMTITGADNAENSRHGRALAQNQTQAWWQGRGYNMNADGLWDWNGTLSRPVLRPRPPAVPASAPLSADLPADAGVILFASPLFFAGRRDFLRKRRAGGNRKE
jgi:hypothetical protein